MASVYVRIGHKDDLVIAQFCDVKIVSVAFGNAAAERGDHALDLQIFQNAVDTRLFHVQYFAAKGQNRLKTAIAALFAVPPALSPSTI